MELNRYIIKENEAELKEIEKDLAKYLGVPFVRCEYDAVLNHKHQDDSEVEYRKNHFADYNYPGSSLLLDYIINYEKYETQEEYDANEGGCDGEVYEIHYLTGIDNLYLVIVAIDE